MEKGTRQLAGVGTTSRSRLARVISVATWLTATVGCSLTTSSIVEEVLDVAGEWALAQKDIAELVPPAAGNPYDVAMRQFLIETEERPFYCGDSGLHAVILVKGCFRAEPEPDALGVIRYVPNPGNLRHEARHAILFALGDDRWPTVGH